MRSGPRWWSRPGRARGRRGSRCAAAAGVTGKGRRRAGPAVRACSALVREAADRGAAADTAGVDSDDVEPVEQDLGQALRQQGGPVPGRVAGSARVDENGAQAAPGVCRLDSQQRHLDFRAVRVGRSSAAAPRSRIGPFSGTSSSAGRARAPGRTRLAASAAVRVWAEVAAVRMWAEVAAAAPGWPGAQARPARARNARATVRFAAVAMPTIVRQRRRQVTGVRRRVGGEACPTLRVGQAGRGGTAEPPSGPEVGEDGENPAVLSVVGRQAELGEDVADVFFHRAGGEHQPPRDGCVGMALGHQCQELPFARGQCRQGTVPALPGQQLGNDLGVEHRRAAGDPVRASRNSSTLATRSFSR